MSLSHLLIIDLDPNSCPADNCGRLAKRIQDFLPALKIDIQIAACFPSETISFSPDLILLRPSFTGNPPGVIPSLRRRWNSVPILGLFCTGRGTPTTVFQSLLKDLDDFLPCPFKEIELLLRVQRLLQRKQESVPTSQAREIKAQFCLEALVGKSRSFLQVMEKIPKFAHSGATVLISGETGTGKELVARAIHYQSLRQGNPFIPVNCGALPDHLVENELFGHEKGAFTDASSTEKGLLAEAEGGTLFLDEVESLSTSAQVKLLRFLQDHVYRPLGSSRSQIANIRVIAATNTDLRQQVQAKQFREDLYHRLNVLFLHLPPLRERIEDIPLLAVHFLIQYGSHDSLESVRLSSGTLQKLMAYPWPGNVRELEGVIQRAVVLTSAPILQPDDLELPLPYPSKVFEEGSFRKAKIQIIEQFERTYLIELLDAHKGNISRAAKQAGKERRAFKRLLRKYGLDRRAFQT
jgi:DNA-binding NtrC family response regulator